MPKERLLEWQPTDGWEPLCAFLGKQVPSTDFPSGNITNEFRNGVIGHIAQYNRRADRNIIIALILVAATVYMLIM